MRGRSTDYYFIDPMIIDILEKSKIPLQVLSVSFRINELSKKIISLNVVKSHLEDLVEKKKIVRKIKKETTVYSLKK